MNNDANEATCKGTHLAEARKPHVPTLDQALTESLTTEAEGRVISLEDASARVKAKIRSTMAKD